jgi:hypothetical protein
MPNIGTVPGDPDGIAVSTTNESTITVWLESGGPPTSPARRPSDWPGC